MLTLEHISFRYDSKKDSPFLFEDLSLSFQDGIITAITGESGIGKTTLLRLLAGLQKPTVGTVHNTYQTTSIIFQEPRLFPWLTALENVTVTGASREEAHELLKQLFGEESVADKYPHELSGGMKHRVSIARALAFSPDLLLMDEPFRGLDEETKHATFSFIREKMKNKTCVLITHDPDDLMQCDQHISLYRQNELTVKLGN